MVQREKSGRGADLDLDRHSVEGKGGAMRDIDMQELFEGMAMHLVAIGTDDFGDKDFAGFVVNKSVMHLQVLNEEGEECLQVVGENSLELAEQLVLACLHNISVEHLGALHLKPLNRALHVKKENGGSEENMT